MEVPSRAYVGVVVFGLIASLLTLAYASVLLSGYQPPADSPYELLFPEETIRPGEWLFLMLTAGYSLVLTWLSSRALLHGARRDMARRRRHEKLKADMRRYADQKRQQPPGFN